MNVNETHLGRDAMPRYIFAVIMGIALTITAGNCLAAEEGKGSFNFPYEAKVAGTDVYVRSGPGHQYYRCGKVDMPATVTVVDENLGWSKIIPPEGSFSWVSKQFVNIDANMPNVGVVTGDNVRIWAGSDYVEPMYSSSMQTKLNEGDRVKLLGEEKGDYYKIKPPVGAYLWVSSQYLEPVREIDIIEPDVPEITKDTNEPAEEEKTAEPEKQEPKAEEKQPEPEPEPVVSKADAELIKKVYDIAKQVAQERAKPLTEQNYSSFKTELRQIVNNPNAEKSSLYAEFQLERIDAYELAGKASELLADQSAELARIRAQIQEKRKEIHSSLKNKADYVVTGKLKRSRVYDSPVGPKRYIVLDPAGKIICYAVATGRAEVLNIDQYVDKKVGLRGEIVPDNLSGISLVKFTEITELDNQTITD